MLLRLRLENKLLCRNVCFPLASVQVLQLFFFIFCHLLFLFYPPVLLRVHWVSTVSQNKCVWYRRLRVAQSSRNHNVPFYVGTGRCEGRVFMSYLEEDEV